jgi:uncharacterized protein (DUF305 family)
MPSRLKILPVLLAGVLLIAGCGDDNTSGDSRAAASANPVDRAFARSMIPHHRSAVRMAQIAQRRSSSTFVKQLADDIVRTQTAEISTLHAADRRLEAAGDTVGSLGVPQHMMGMDDDPASLKTAKPFDPALLKMMIPHHEGAVVMANAELKKGNDPQLKTLAQKIITAQRHEITEMRKHLDGHAATSDKGEAMDEHGAEHPG